MKKIFNSKKRIAFFIISMIVVFSVFVNVCASVFFSFAIFKKDGWKKFEEYSYGEELPSESVWISEKSEEMQIENEEGKKLAALKIKNEHVSHSYMIICHQYGGSPESMEDYAKHFYALGFNIILPYMRGHGESPYNWISFGWEDRLDIADWIDEIISNDKEARIALFGVSLGANAVTLAAAEELPENVRLVISDSCYTSLDKFMKEYINNKTGLSSLIGRTIISAYVEEKIGISLKNADTVEQLENIELPIMFINGENDVVIPPLLSKKLYENCEAYGVEEVIIENGTHGRNLEADKESYWANIDSFILNYIGI